MAIAKYLWYIESMQRGYDGLFIFKQNKMLHAQKNIEDAKNEYCSKGNSVVKILRIARLYTCRRCQKDFFWAEFKEHLKVDCEWPDAARDLKIAHMRLQDTKHDEPVI